MQAAKSDRPGILTPCIKLARAVGRRLPDEPEEDHDLMLVRVQGRYRSHLAACAVDPRSRAYALLCGESP